MNETEKAWAAGLFEGEGCISIYSKTTQNRPTVRLILRMTDEDVVRRFHSIVSTGTVIVQPNGKHKTMYTWSVGSYTEVKSVIKDFLPYLGQRRKEKALIGLSISEGNYDN